MKNTRQYFRWASWLTVFICLPWAAVEGQESYLVATVKAPLEATNLHPDITEINMEIVFFRDVNKSNVYSNSLDRDGNGCETEKCREHIFAEGTASVAVPPEADGTINVVVEIPIMLDKQNEFGANISWGEVVGLSRRGQQRNYILHIWANGDNGFKVDGSSADPAFNLASSSFRIYESGKSEWRYARRGDVDDLLTE